MVLRTGFLLIATKLQEAADAMAHSNVRDMLSKAVRDAYPDKYAYYQDHTGDGESGDCIYGCDGELKSAPYEIGAVGGKTTANVDTSNAKRVQSVVSYKDQADDDDHYSGMEEAFKKAALYLGGMPLYERFISKSERDAADEGDFAGKGKSFPILKPGDVQAAVHAMGRAGSSNLGMAALKARIIAIAKKKGWTSELPKAWQDGDDDKAAKEAARLAALGGLRLVESAACLESIVLREAKGRLRNQTDRSRQRFERVLPGRSAEARRTEVFKAGTHVYVNHPTFAEEAARPEGDVKKLAGAPHHGRGVPRIARERPWPVCAHESFQPITARWSKRRPTPCRHEHSSPGRCRIRQKQRRRSGSLELTSAESVDVVTRAGAGGMILTEAARTANSQGDDMSEDEKKRLFEAARIVEQGHAREVATQALSDVSLIEAGKSRVIDTVIRMGLPMKDGVLDQAKFVETVKAEAVREGAYLASLLGTGVRGMGSAPASVTLTEKEQKQARKAEKRLQEAANSVFSDLTGDPRAGALAAHGRAA